MIFSGIPNRIGYYNKKSGWLLTQKITPPNKYVHRVEYFLGIGEAVGIKPKSINYDFFISINDKDRAIELLKEKGIGQGEDFIVINPGGNWDLKRWPIENFARLSDEIFSRYNIKVVLTGSLKDIYLCKRISDLMKYKQVLLCGETDLKTLGAVFTKAKWVVSNDSGPMHIAVAVRVSVIALFGPTSSTITGPYGEGIYKILEKDIGCKKPCYNLNCKDNRCMKAITVEDVLEVMESQKAKKC
jgi:lipopolysaccharide heptosyltransferase II